MVTTSLCSLFRQYCMPLCVHVALPDAPPVLPLPTRCAGKELVSFCLLQRELSQDVQHSPQAWDRCWPVVPAWGNAPWSGTYINCVLVQGSRDKLTIFLILIKSVHSEALDVIWHCLFSLSKSGHGDCVRKPDAGTRSGLESFLSLDTLWLSTFLSS